VTHFDTFFLGVPATVIQRRWRALRFAARKSARPSAALRSALQEGTAAHRLRKKPGAPALAIWKGRPFGA
jgi:hypothetical protein